MSVRDLLRQNPSSFLELVELFEAYLSTIDDPILQAVNLLRDRFGDRLTFEERGDVNELAMRPVNDVRDMRRWLEQQRGARLASGSVQIEMSRADARVLALHLREATALLHDTSDMIDLVRGRLDEVADEVSPGISGVLSLSSRAIADCADRQGAQFRKLAKALDHATADDLEEAKQ
ncbi:hypothetical protein [Paracoccus sanguinis]|uniref:hypothetical protein n=1 Tax=Paracoccus sanguinis TaxID=1545044 RepID=UPI00051F90D1|nr:hypothetical protein [Paracoccus sanguinis]KGJ20715.1 hypothetical protein IX55_05150 [Paracoccus sanguinis]